MLRKTAVNAAHAAELMKVAERAPPLHFPAAHAIAGTIREDELTAEYIIPSVFDRRVAEAVAKDVEDAAYRTGVARRERDRSEA